MSIDEYSVDTYILLAKCYLGLNNFSKGIEYLNKGINKYPNSSKIYCEFGFEIPAGRTVSAGISKRRKLFAVLPVILTSTLMPPDAVVCILGARRGLFF